MTRLTLAASLSALALVLLACGGTAPRTGVTNKDGKVVPCHVTMAAYNAVKTGMTYDEVVRVVGCHGEENARTELGGTVTVLVTWKNPGGANMNCTFQDGRVASKAQFGLR